MSNNLKDLVKKVQFKYSLKTQEDVASRLGYTREYLSLAMKNNSQTVIDKLFLVFPELLQNEVNSKKGDRNTKVTEVPAQQPIKEKKDESASYAAIQSIADSNARLAEGNMKLIDANVDLVRMLKFTIPGMVNLDLMQEIQQEEHTRVSVLEKLVIDFGVLLKVFPTVQAGHDEMSKLLGVSGGAKKANHNHESEGK